MLASLSRRVRLSTARLAYAVVLVLAAADAASAQINGSWSGTLGASSLVSFGGPPYCFYDEQFTNISVALNIANNVVNAATVSALSTERPIQPCPYTTGPPTTHRYVLGSASLVGSSVTVQLVQTDGYPAAELVLSGIISPDRQTIAASLGWHRTDQVAPLDWRIQASLALQSPTSALGIPTALRSQVAGNAVTLSWNAVAGAAAYIVQVGTSVGASNLVTVTVPQPTISGAAPSGAYFWRVLAINGAAVGTPSAESQFNVGGPPTAGVPGIPTGLTSQVNGNQVTLSWSPASGNAASSYVVEAGSASGASDVAVFDTGSATTTLSANAPNGLYYVRVRGKNAAGTGAASNDVTVAVNMAAGCLAGMPLGEAIPAPPVVRPRSGTAQVQLVRGRRPRYDAAAGPAVTVSGRPGALSDVVVRSGSQFNSAAISAGIRSVQPLTTGAAPACEESYYVVQLSEPQTEIDVTVPSQERFTLDVAASANRGATFGAPTSYRFGPPIFTGLVRVSANTSTNPVYFGPRGCLSQRVEYWDLDLRFSHDFQIQPGTVSTQSIESVVPGCPGNARGASPYRFSVDLQNSQITGSAVVLNFRQDLGTPEARLSFPGTLTCTDTFDECELRGRFIFERVLQPGEADTERWVIQSTISYHFFRRILAALPR